MESVAVEQEGGGHRVRIREFDVSSTRRQKKNRNEPFRISLTIREDLEACNRSAS